MLVIQILEIHDNPSDFDKHMTDRSIFCVRSERFEYSCLIYSKNLSILINLDCKVPKSERSSIFSEAETLPVSYSH